MDWIKIFNDAAEATAALADGQPRLLVVRDKRICLTRFNKELLAVQDKCTHNGESLSKGRVNHLGEIICPWHGYRFHLKTGRECLQQSDDLECFPIKESEAGIFVGL